VIEDEGKVAAYLFGFFSQTEPVGYVNLIAVREGYQGQGLGRQLYDHFIDAAAAHGCTHLKAITSPTNAASIGFHTRLGMTLLGEPNEQGIPVVKDYHSPSHDMVVFSMKIADYRA
jgi:L-amino acid N-acyltransferase YncA